MKRSELKRHTPIRRSTTPLPKVNERQQAARRKRLAKLRRSPEHREALRVAKERSGGRCEWTTTGKDVGGGVIVRTHGLRCDVTDSLEGHHDSYDPPRIRMLCRRHHELTESELRPWNKGRLGR